MSLTLRRLKRIRRRIYSVRQYIPWLRERHQLEIMVGPLGYWDKLQKYQLNLLRVNGLKPHHKLLDIGCGPLQGGTAFIKYLNKENYYGIDIKKNVIDIGKKQIIKNKLTVKNPFLSYSETFGQFEIKNVKFDFMWASQVLYYFDEAVIRSLMKMISSTLSENGKFLGDIIGPKHYEFRLREHNWILHTVESLRNIAKDYGLKVEELGEIEKYGYPKKLSLRTNILVEITRQN